MNHCNSQESILSETDHTDPAPLEPRKAHPPSPIPSTDARRFRRGSPGLRWTIALGQWGIQVRLNFALAQGSVIDSQLVQDA